MPKTIPTETRKMTGVKFSSEIQLELDACQAAASERAGVQSLPLSTVLTEIVKLGLPLYKERIGLVSKPATKPSKNTKSTAA